MVYAVFTGVADTERNNLRSSAATANVAVGTMNQINLIFTIPDNQSQSWKHWSEIQHYGGWLRHIGDFRSDITIGNIQLDPWNGKEKQRAKEISNQFTAAHAVGEPGPNDTVKVAYRYKKKVKFFSLSRKEVSDIRDEVLALVSKQMENRVRGDLRNLQRIRRRWLVDLRTR